MSGTISLAFVLLLVLILAAYYTGVSSDAQAIGGQLTNLTYAVSGRNNNGQFAGYPQGTPGVTTAA